ncbi:hemin uptake protein HemP [Rhodobacteraceae bacterium NNCM2]|nr:hemin uptake protein HemP [Coraliihabitans acroporae]
MDREVCLTPAPERLDSDKPNQATPSHPPREIDSKNLLGDERSVTIRHGDQVYTLRITRADKLLLTK